MNPSVKDTDAYLQALPHDQALALQKLRKQILSAATGCEEYFGYGLPGFRLHGKPLLYMGAAKSHCALYGMMPTGFETELKDFKRTKGSIQFVPGKPIPAAVVKAIVKMKVLEIEEQLAKKGARSTRTRKST
ncbi:MAG: DUF1801 domain-containing protein [Flavobacteriales bacterium]|nr:DUF1801 domain-containing protein [Flavobacteriales bacterium]